MGKQSFRKTGNSLTRITRDVWKPKLDWLQSSLVSSRLPWPLALLCGPCWSWHWHHKLRYRGEHVAPWLFLLLLHAEIIQNLLRLLATVCCLHAQHFHNIPLGSKWTLSHQISGSMEKSESSQACYSQWSLQLLYHPLTPLSDTQGFASESKSKIITSKKKTPALTLQKGNMDSHV